MRRALGILLLLLLGHAAGAEEVRQVRLLAQDLVYDPRSRRIYASTSAAAPIQPNSVVPIDPLTGVMEPPIFVGGSPAKMAVSDDGQYLYVALEDLPAVRRIELPTRTAGLQFPLGDDGSTFGHFYAEDLAVLPGHPGSVAVARKYRNTFPGHAGVAIYDDGRARPHVTPVRAGSTRIAFGDSASDLYGFDHAGAPPAFYRMRVDASGVSVRDAIPAETGDFRFNFQVSAGRVYMSTGQVLDPAADTLVGAFPGLPSSPAYLAADARDGRAFFLVGSYNYAPDPPRLLAYDTRSFRQVGALPLFGVAGMMEDLIRWGEDGLAFRTDNYQVILLRTLLVPRGPAPRAQIAVYRPPTRQWLLRGEDGSPTVIPFGGPGDLPVPADYLGSGAAQLAVFRPSTREWFLRDDPGSTHVIPWGGPDDVPVPADYLGLGHAQITVFRPATGEWFVRREGGDGVVIPFGGTGDQPVPADYFGLSRAQPAVFHPGTAEWLLRTDDGRAVPIQWGARGDRPTPADYLGLGHAQIAVFRPATAEWFVRSDQGEVIRIPFGAPGDQPVPADYLGLGRAQIAVFRPSTGQWFLRTDDGSAVEVPWGTFMDQPIAAAFGIR
jgi:hypothetical protein